MSIPAIPGIPSNIIQNPTVRKVAGNVLAVVALVVVIAVLVDQSIDAIDYAFITKPAALIVGGLFGIFQLGVTSPNVPTPKAVRKAIRKDPTVVIGEHGVLSPAPIPAGNATGSGPEHRA